MAVNCWTAWPVTEPGDTPGSAECTRVAHLHVAPFCFMSLLLSCLLFCFVFFFFCPILFLYLFLLSFITYPVSTLVINNHHKYYHRLYVIAKKVNNFEITKHHIEFYATVLFTNPVQGTMCPSRTGVHLRDVSLFSDFILPV